jgi:DNA-directed RNA polymerase specialized sigma24 family protein
MFAAERMNPDELDDAKAFELLCGTDAQREVACAYYFRLYRDLLAGCVRKQYPSLPSDLVADAVSKAFLEFYQVATASKDFDPERPQRLLLKIALRRACDEFRKHTHRGKYKEESLETIASALAGTDTGADWSVAVSGMRAREVQSLFRIALEKFGDKQRSIARLMVDALDDNVTDIKLAELYREKFNTPITVPAAKRAREEVRIKFRELLRKNGGH